MKYYPDAIVTNPFKDAYNWTKETFIGLAAKWNFLLAKGEALRRCEVENRKFYVVQASKTNWTVFSTLDVNMLKRRGIFRKDITAKELTETAAFYCVPKNIKNEKVKAKEKKRPA